MNQGKEFVTRDKPLFDTFEAFLKDLQQPGLVEQVLGEPAVKTSESYEDRYGIWVRFNEYLTRSSERERYRQSLTYDQLTSYDVLARFFQLLGHCYKVSPIDVLRRADSSLEEADLFFHRLGSEISYSSVVSFLFWFEMESSANWSSEYVMANLSHWRIEAFKHDSAFQVALSCYKKLKFPQISTDHLHVGPLIEDVRDWKDSDLPFYLWEISSRKLVLVNQLSFFPKYTCVSHTWGRWMISDSPSSAVKLSNVPWPIPRNSRFEIENLPQILAQVNWLTEYIWFDLLCIPQLEFDPALKDQEIAKQAGIFANSTACVAWLNDVENWEKVMPALEWLCLKYLSADGALPHEDLDQALVLLSEALEDGQRLFQKQYYSLRERGSTGVGEKQWHDRRESNIAELHSKYCCPRSLGECFNIPYQKSRQDGALTDFNRLLEFPDWFTSLWTLQEACLCPEMSLADASFKYLSSDMGVHYTLRGITMLLNVVTDAQKPRAVRQLRLCLPHDFGHASPMNVIMMGNERQCTGQRAPAIMSVLGLTKWYNELLEEHGEIPSDVPQVFGKYALPFVQEAAREIGPLFFGTTGYDVSNHNIGSMLPFFQKEGTLASFPFDITAARVDAKHRAWEIGVNGEVVIEEAVVIAASRNNSLELPPVHVSASIFGLDIHVSLDYDLQTILDRLSGGENDEVESYAVHLSQDTTRKIGIILSGAPSLNSDRFLVAKFGAYSIEFDEDEATALLSRGMWPRVPKPIKVDWLAL